MKNINSLSTISPIDGRYHKEAAELSEYFSEMALMKYRLMMEIEYFIALSLEPKIKELPELSVANQKKLRVLYEKFSVKEAEAVKKIESVTDHDVKAIEYYINKKLRGTELEKYNQFVHFALTSEDVNNIAYSLMWRDAIKKVYLPTAKELGRQLQMLAKKYKLQAMLSLTHGQSATPTTVGKEFAVFFNRFRRQIYYLKLHRPMAKLSGATGTWSAHKLAYPEVNWIEFTKKFIYSLGLEPNLFTTQIEPHDTMAEAYHQLARANTILIDFCRDTWLYISRGIFGQKKKAGEVGSSTMPHKINPIKFENAEGNLGIANAYLVHLSQKLPISRMQRDLTDSTVLRNQGMPLAHSLLACKQILKGLSRLTINKVKLKEELDSSWEVLSEAIQTILRKHGHQDAYEQLKKLTRGQEMNKASLQKFVKGLDIPKKDKDKLLKLTPQTYTGLARKLAETI